MSNIEMYGRSISFFHSEHYHGKNPNKKKINEKSRSKAFQDQDENDIEE
jgi:hypothetical protein